METKTEKTGKTSEARQLNRRLARALFRQTWGAENPEASAEDRKAAFKAAQGEYLEKARQLKKQLKKSGIELSLAAEISKEAEEGAA